MGIDRWGGWKRSQAEVVTRTDVPAKLSYSQGNLGLDKISSDAALITAVEITKWIIIFFSTGPDLILLPVCADVPAKLRNTLGNLGLDMIPSNAALITVVEIA